MKYKMMLSACALIMFSNISAFGFLKTQGYDIVDEKGEKFFIRGINLGNWLNPEGYMFAFSTCNSARMINDMFCKLVGPIDTAKFWKSFKDNYVTEKDIEFIASTGSNTVRLPFNYRSFTDEDYMGITGENDGFERIDKLIEWCRKYSLKIILDMHACPGGQTGENIDDSYGSVFLFEDEAYQQQYCEIWRKIAARYKDENVILGYDLMNEPISAAIKDKYDTKLLDAKLEGIQQLAAREIRKVDKNHILIFAGANWNTRFDMFSDFSFDSNMMFSCHYYRFNQPIYTDGAVQCYVAFRKKSGVPMYMGETGHNVPEWYKALKDSMETNNIGWTFWPYKKQEKGGWVNFPLPKGWEETIRVYAEGPHHTHTQARKNRPDRAKSLQLMKEFAENCKFENCKVDKEYLSAINLKHHVQK